MALWINFPMVEFDLKNIYKVYYKSQEAGDTHVSKTHGLMTILMAFILLSLCLLSAAFTAYKHMHTQHLYTPVFKLPAYSHYIIIGYTDHKLLTVN